MEIILEIPGHSMTKRKSKDIPGLSRTVATMYCIEQAIQWTQWYNNIFDRNSIINMIHNFAIYFYISPVVSF